MSVNISGMMSELGFEGFNELRPGELRLLNLVTAAKVGFSDGDVEVLHELFTADFDREHFGEINYSDGTVANALGSAALYRDPYDTSADIYGFQEFIANLITEEQKRDPSSQFGGARSTVSIHSDSVVVDERFLLPLLTPPSAVLELGACLSSRSIIDDQLRMATINRGAFTYVPLTRNHFVNRMLVSQYDRRVGDGASHTALRNRLYIGREDGSALSTQAIINDQEAHGAPTDIIDLALCVGLQHMSHEDIFDSLPRMKQLLRPTGKLIVRALEKPSSHEVGFGQIAEAIQDNGLVLSESIGYNSNDHMDVHALLKGEPSPVRKFRTASFQRTQI
jgi:hypothetical protein